MSKKNFLTHAQTRPTALGRNSGVSSSPSFSCTRSSSFNRALNDSTKSVSYTHLYVPAGTSRLHGQSVRIRFLPELSVHSQQPAIHFPHIQIGCPPPAARGRALAPGRPWNIPAAFPLRGGAPASGKTGRQGRRALEQTKGPSALQGGQAGENRQTVLRFWPQRCPASPASGPGCGQGIRHAVCP